VTPFEFREAAELRDPALEPDIVPGWTMPQLPNSTPPGNPGGLTAATGSRSRNSLATRPQRRKQPPANPRERRSDRRRPVAQLPWSHR